MWKCVWVGVGSPQLQVLSPNWWADPDSDRDLDDDELMEQVNRCAAELWMGLFSLGQYSIAQQKVFRLNGIIQAAEPQSVLDSSHTSLLWGECVSTYSRARSRFSEGHTSPPSPPPPLVFTIKTFLYTQARTFKSHSHEPETYDRRGCTGGERAAGQRILIKPQPTLM